VVQKLQIHYRTLTLTVTTKLIIPFCK